MIKCSKCGHLNPLGHIFCVQCRSKLDIQAVDNPAWKEPKPKRKGQKWVLPLILVTVVAVIALALWPAPLQGPKGTLMDAEQARIKITLLEKSLSPTSQVFAEREINAYLRLLLEELSPRRAAGFFSVTLQGVEVVIRPRAVQLSTRFAWQGPALGSFQLPPKSIATRVTFVPERGPRGFQWTITAGRIGYLPLPGPFKALAVPSLRPLREIAIRERALLADLNQLELGGGQVTVALTRRARPGP